MKDVALKVDVIIPVYNGARYLAEAIGSVLAQTYPQIELFVVDDGSVDESAAIAAQIPGVRLLQQPHRGIGAALNQAIRQGKGDLIAFLDADDRWLPEKLEKQVCTLMTDPMLDMVFGHVRQFHQAGVAICGDAQPGIHRGSMLVRRSAFERVGPFDEDPHMHGFVDWYARACEANLCMRVLSDVLYERRIHDNNLGQQMRDAQRQSYLRTLRLSVARRKAAG